MRWLRRVPKIYGLYGTIVPLLAYALLVPVEALKVRLSRIEVRAERLDVSADRAFFTISLKFVLPLSRKKRLDRAGLLRLNLKTC